MNDQRDAQILFYVFISMYNSLHVSSTQCPSSGETNCPNTASGNSHSMLVAEMCAGWKKSIEENLCITLVIHQESPTLLFFDVILLFWVTSVAHLNCVGNASNHPSLVLLAGLCIRPKIHYQCH